MENSKKKTSSSLRWGILRRALINKSSTTKQHSDEQSQKSISRKANRGFGLIPFRLADKGELQHEELKAKEACVCYTLPDSNDTKLFIYQRVDNCANLDDFKICNAYDIDNTGLVCAWPSEEVLAYYCLSNLDLFRSKRVIELGSGYGLAGLLIAAATEALEVVISDGNPQVVDYIQRNINANTSVFGGTKVKSMMLHWNQEELSDISNSFDIIVASDCTFFKEFHKGLVQTVKCLLCKECPSEAIFFGPKRGNSLDEFLIEVKESGLQFTIDEIYHTEVWRRHQSFIDNDALWPNYEKDHCYPLLGQFDRREVGVEIMAKHCSDANKKDLSGGVGLTQTTFVGVWKKLQVDTIIKCDASWKKEFEKKSLGFLARNCNEEVLISGAMLREFSIRG